MSFFGNKARARKTTGSKLLGTAIVLALVAVVAGIGTWSAFSSTTSNPNNSFDAGTVVISDNDSGTAMYQVTNAKPGTSVTKCIKVTYSGSLDADVHLYTTDTIGSLGQYIDMTITPGTQTSPSFPSCTGFTADSGGALYTGTLANFASTKSSYANGIVDFPGTSATKWVTNDSVVYQFTLTLQDNNAAQGLSTGTHSFTWEARNQ